jgi:hypothetical protein
MAEQVRATICPRCGRPFPVFGFGPIPADMKCDMCNVMEHYRSLTPIDQEQENAK